MDQGHKIFVVSTDAAQLTNAIVIRQKKKNNKKCTVPASLQDEVHCPCNHEHEVATALHHFCVYGQMALPLLEALDLPSSSHLTSRTPYIHPSFCPKHSFKTITL
jgi:hypothetical protein